MEKVFGEEEYPKSAFHLFSNVTLSRKGKILLTLSEDRKDRNIWTPVGGEIKVRLGQTPHEAAVAEVYEEAGLEIDPRKLVLIGEPQLIYPTEEYNPYPAKGVEGGAGIIIFSYAYTGKWNPKDIVWNEIPKKRCMIVDHAYVNFPYSLQEIKKWPYNLYSNYALKLLEFVKMTREGKLSPSSFLFEKNP